MKKNLLVTAVAMLFALAVSASAQKAAADFSGKWTLDLSKSKLSDREKSSIESQTLTVTQTAADIKIEPATKRAAPSGPPAGGPPPSGDRPAGGPPGGGMGGGGGRGMGGGGDMATTYQLGKETTTEQQMGQMTMPVTLGSKWEGSKLVLHRSSTMNTPNGEMKRSTKDVYELGADGKTLTINRETSGGQGSVSSTWVYTKN